MMRQPSIPPSVQRFYPFAEWAGSTNKPLKLVYAIVHLAFEKVCSTGNLVE
ncbi:MAG: hypothetical protein AVDCRST_MAG31-1574 [uncultured Sphingomonas sp.]|uniref:Uncharacterized protein n=1 Tax=uncultured Sphingomonas sp. TaxID=158754 RepID=A0A6J4TE92_9SPHN|nr:MAG: hypothetical protein AVDCRST_MAG31-1574 [uncultured Sphingomonas sp.]